MPAPSLDKLRFVHEPRDTNWWQAVVPGTAIVLAHWRGQVEEWRVTAMHSLPISYRAVNIIEQRIDLDQITAYAVAYAFIEKYYGTANTPKRKRTRAKNSQVSTPRRQRQTQRTVKARVSRALTA